MKTIPTWLPEEFELLNARHFDGKLPKPGDFLVNNWGGHFAVYAPVVRLFFFHERTLDQDRSFVSDTLLHEMLHCALEVDSGDHEQHHGPRFVALANKIAATLGLPSLAVGDEKVLEWPQSVRPAGYSPWRQSQ
jgi:hypothetical protein